MFSMLRLFWPICQLQQGPQDLPASTALLRVTMLAYCMSGVLIATLTVTIAEALLRVSVSLALSLLIWPVLMQVLKRQARLLQTLTAALGCATIIQFLMWPLLMLLIALGEKSGLLPFFALAIALWSIVISGHILRHSLDWPLPRALALAVLLFGLRIGAMQLIAPLN